MDMQYSVSEIIKAMGRIDGTEKDIDENEFGISNLKNINVNMNEEPKEINEEPKEINEEPKEINEEPAEALESSSLQPIQIEEIVKIGDPGSNEQDSKQDILVLTDPVTEEDLSEDINFEKQDAKEIKKLKEQVSILIKHNALLEGDLNKLSRKNNQNENEEELKIKLELLYKQQRTIIDYGSQISKLKEQIKSLQEKFELPLTQQNQEEDLKNKSNIIVEQQGILNEYQDKISRLKNENLSLKQNNETITKKLTAETKAREESSNANIEKLNEKIEKLNKKIEYYQEDNLRLSNELAQLRGKFENTKTQLKQFENNKSKLMTQLESLKNTVSENNIIGTSFSSDTSTTQDEIKEDKKISDEKQVLQKEFLKIGKPKNTKDLKEMDHLAEEIFKK